MPGRRVIYLTSLVGCVIFYLAYREWFSGLVLTAVLFLPLFSLLVSLPAMLTARVELRLPKAVTMGTPQDLTIFYGSRLPTPPWRVLISVTRPITGERWVMKDVQELPTEHCGTLECVIKKAKVCDYLGLIAIPMRKGDAQRLVVRPKPVPVSLEGLERAVTKAWLPKRGGGFAENHELRLYRPGDSVQQIHWKLSAKTGSLILREPMVPVRNRLVLQLDLRGSREVLDRKLGQLLWAGQQLLERDLHFCVQALTGEGVRERAVTGEVSLTRAIDALLRASPADTGSVLDLPQNADWQAFLGGDADEA